MAGYLTSKEQNSINIAVLEYLEFSFPDAATAFRREAGLESYNVKTEQHSGMLTRKWTLITRLSKQIKQLQKHANARESTSKMAGLLEIPKEHLKDGNGCASKARGIDIPNNQPSIVSLVGHRGAITVIDGIVSSKKKLKT